MSVPFYPPYSYDDPRIGYDKFYLDDKGEGTRNVATTISMKPDTKIYLRKPIIVTTKLDKE